MPLLREHLDPGELSDRLRAAPAVTAELMSEVIVEACRRFPSVGQTEKTARIERLIQSDAWTDAALALIDLELPLWQVRRIAYDEGEWYCALSRERELPDWLDRSIEARHAGSAAGDPERVRRGPAHRGAVEPSERPHRVTQREPALRAGLLRQFRVSRDRADVGASVLAQFPNLSRELSSTRVLVRFFLRVIILAVFAAFASVGFARGSCRAAVDVDRPLRRHRRHEARAAVRRRSQSLGRDGGLCGHVCPGQQLRSCRPGLRQPGGDPIRRL